MDPLETTTPAMVLGARTGDLAALWGLCLLTALTWLVPLARDPGFSYDDREAIVGNPVVEGEVPLGRAFTQDYWHHYEDAGHYRPMATVLLAMDRGRTADPEPRVFRLTNVVLHVGLLLTLGLALLRLSARWRIPAPWFGLAVFAVHPICADVVAWISGRTSLVSGWGAAIGLLVVSAVRPARRYSLAFAGAAAGTGLALLGKEDGVVVAAVLPVLAWALGGWRSGAAAALGSAASMAGVMGLRAAALGSALPSSPAPMLGDAGLAERLSAGVGAWWNGIAQTLMPWRAAPPSLEASDITPIDGLLGLTAVALAAALLVRSITAKDPARARPRAAAWAPALSFLAMLIAALPLVQIVPAGELFAPRFMYQPLLLGTFFVSWLAGLILRPLGALSGLVQVLAIAGLMVLSATAGSARYQDRQSYWESHLPAHGDSAQVWTAIGQARQEAGDPDAARAAYLRAIELDGSYGAPWAKLGELELRKDDLMEAEMFLRRAITEDPGAVAARANLARTVLSAGDPDEAARLYREAIALAPGRAALHRGLARAHLEGGHLDTASKAAAKALALSPQDRLSLRLAATIRARLDRAGSDPRVAPQ